MGLNCIDSTRTALVCNAAQSRRETKLAGRDAGPDVTRHDTMHQLTRSDCLVVRHSRCNISLRPSLPDMELAGIERKCRAAYRRGNRPTSTAIQSRLDNYPLYLLEGLHLRSHRTL